MSASAASAVPAAHPLRKPNRTLERAFFAFMSLLMLATVLFGFARTYFLAGMVTAPLPNRLIHFHGAVFSLWILLLLVQTALITTGNVRIHRALGVYGFCLAILMCILGPLASLDMHRRGEAPLGLTADQFLIIPLTGISMFAFFMVWSWRTRREPAAHKRLILLATIVLTDAALGRWPVAALQQHPPLMGVVEVSFVLLIVLYDLISLRKVHRTTAIGLAIVAVVIFTRVPIAQTHPWATVARSIGRL
ncbi:hypothetical protein SAMN05421819_2102 [Bryocella elongata]|uniref:Uncharacterized protein n=1 Tax=Bryocella elongata TaxID=863522 RepID=A0A1H5Y3Z0_9BACT|nr:hypothetical protein [Bryocella elongata]SEG18515.1 hypothetical protein SAMN05421819_2102 [Bryocella elongata]